MRSKNRSRIAAMAMVAAASLAFAGAASVDGFSNAAFAGNGGGHGISGAAPNQNALDAHIRNQNFNGTVGALPMFQLAHELQEVGYDALTPEQQAAVDALFEEHGLSGSTPNADQLSLLDLAVLDANATGDAVYYYMFDDTTGTFTVSCTDGTTACDIGIEDGLQSQADAIELSDGASDLVTISEDVIRERSNKTFTPETEETLLNDIASDFGVLRASTEDVVSDGSDAISDADSAILGLFSGI